jgi:hypothetical protein
MRKAVGSSFLRDLESAAEKWMDLRQLSRVLVSSEDPNSPIESVFSFGQGPGARYRRRGPYGPRFFLWNIPLGHNVQTNRRST